MSPMAPKFLPKSGSGDQEGAVGIIGGKGVGVVTAKGLQCAVGEPAINPVPRKMIRENCRRILEKYGAKRGINVEISVPGGEEIAKRRSIRDWG